MDSRLLITVRHMYEAEAIRELLKNNGIPCEYKEYGAESIMRIAGWINPGGHGIDIFVPEKCFQEARELTEQFSEDFVLQISDEELEEEALRAGGENAEPDGEE